MVNVIAPIFTKPDGLFLQTIYHPLRLYAEHTREVALDVHVAGDTHDLPPAAEAESFGWNLHVADLGPFALLDAAATCDDDGRRVTLTVVNRDPARDVEAEIDLGGAVVAGSVDVAEVNGPSVDATNSFEAPAAVGVRERRAELRGPRPLHRFPAHSVSVLRFETRAD